MDVHFERGQRVTADRLNAVAGIASGANIRSASWSVYNNGDSLVFRPPRRDSTMATRYSRSSAGRVYVGRVTSSDGYTVKVVFNDGKTYEVSVLNSTSQTRFVKDQNILVHEIQLEAVDGTYEVT